jgi:hypothetical protein
MLYVRQFFASTALAPLKARSKLSCSHGIQPGQ